MYFKINPDQKYVEGIKKGLEKKQGHCPCKMGMNPENQCPCVEFIETGNCHCNLFLKVELREVDDNGREI